MMSGLDKIKKHVKGEFPNWTDDEIAFLAEEMFEMQCVIEADLNVAMAGKEKVTVADVKAAAIASIVSLKK